jgi:hypothetical protein
MIQGPVCSNSQGWWLDPCSERLRVCQLNKSRQLKSCRRVQPPALGLVVTCWAHSRLETSRKPALLVANWATLSPEWTPPPPECGRPSTIWPGSPVGLEHPSSAPDHPPAFTIRLIHCLHHPTHPFISQYMNNCPPVQISRIDRQTLAILGSVQVNLRSENAPFGPTVRVGGKGRTATQNRRNGHGIPGDATGPLPLPPSHGHAQETATFWWGASRHVTSCCASTLLAKRFYRKSAG